MSRPRATGATTSRCPSCGAHLYTQWVGRVAALHATVDTTPISPDTEQQIRGPDRLTWCLITGRWRTPELRWRCWKRTCQHQIVAEHHCTTAPSTLF